MCVSVHTPKSEQENPSPLHQPDFMLALASALILTDLILGFKGQLTLLP